MSEHTPGPWSIGHVRKCSTVQNFNEHFVHVGANGVNGGQGNVIAVVHMGGPGALRNEIEYLEANARLIAAAPKLLEACSDKNLIALLEWIAKGKCECDPEVGAAPCERCAASSAHRRIAAAIAAAEREVTP